MEGEQAVNWQLIAGAGFAFILVVFFMIAYFNPPKRKGGDNILRILAAILAGSAGAFLTGGITIEAQGTISSGANIGIRRRRRSTVSACLDEMAHEARGGLSCDDQIRGIVRVGGK